MSYYYDGLRDAYHLIQKREQKKANLTGCRQGISEAYVGGYGYRTTASGNRVPRTEPGEAEQFRQSDAIQKAVQKKRALASKEILKAANKVPVKKGKKMFEDFRKEANERRGNTTVKKKPTKELEQMYLSARALEFDKWLLFIREML